MSSDPNSENLKEIKEITDNSDEVSVQKGENTLKEPSAGGEVQNDFHVIETELNQHIKEAGLFYQSLGDSLRRMESAHKKIYQQHKTTSVQIQQLKNKTTTAETELAAYKHKFNAILTLCFLLIVVVVGLVFYAKGLENNTFPNLNTNQDKPHTENNASNNKNDINLEKKPTAKNHNDGATNKTTPPVKIKDTESPTKTIPKEISDSISNTTQLFNVEIIEKKIIEPDENKSKLAEEQSDKKALEKEEKEKTKIVKKEKKAKKKLIKKIWSEYQKAISKANLTLAKEKLQKIIIIEPNHDMANSLLKQLNEPLPELDKEEKPQ
ncbi:MAG: hypothetical protein COA79_03055 [Planctomycetota bacterium]|nr:MAG: hypothetical protein COA79_03055 [Planctomycetota bacterium]